MKPWSLWPHLMALLFGRSCSFLFPLISRGFWLELVIRDGAVAKFLLSNPGGGCPPAIAVPIRSRMPLSLVHADAQYVAALY